MKSRLIVLGIGTLMAALLVWAPADSGEVGAAGHGPQRADLRGRPVLAAAAAEQLAARLDHRGLGRRTGPRLDRAPRQPRAERDPRRARPAVRRGVLPSGAPGPGVRPGGQPHPALGRTRRGLRLARVEPRHLGRSHGQRLDRRQRRRRFARPEVHARRRFPPADRRGRPPRARQQLDDALLAGRQGHLRRRGQRGVPGRRLRQPARGGGRRRHRRAEALLGRLRQHAERRRAAALRRGERAGARCGQQRQVRRPAVPEPGALRRPDQRRPGLRRATVRATGCRCSPRRASSSRRST